ncbi:hypothetical protein AB834_00015 [PVC group bacterium (ex Bugula neritina AB1)]|nr:hypothetical protein AB834_00015 [PVC group bacterium (ex Bugula neritina AB1)]
MKKYGFHFDTTYTNLPDPFFTELEPQKVEEPNLVILNKKLSRSMGLDFSDLSLKKQAELFSGNDLPKGSTPFSQAYAGHQFAHFTMLGDGRAHLWGEHIMPNKQRVDIQFKGSGRTPYSRGGDGKAPLSPMLREYLISEAMFFLGIPTTRSLAVVTTGEAVMRETPLPGAILTRIAGSHIRVGTFQFAAYFCDKEALVSLMDYTIERHYSDLLDNVEIKNKPLALIKAFMERQVDLVVNWMRVGFIHGVMNTDNMTLSGETIDYGPCAFMDQYDPDTVFSYIDQMGRYAYGNQPKIAEWNLARFAETLLPLIDDDRDKAIFLAEELLSDFSDMYHLKWLRMMCCKLGLFGSYEGDERLVLDLLTWMHKNEADYTQTFYDLSEKTQCKNQVPTKGFFRDWYLRWQDRVLKNEKPLEDSLSLMKKYNPVVIPRNHKVEEALNMAGTGDLDAFCESLKAIKEPYKNIESFKSFQLPPNPDERVFQTFCGT